MIAVAAAWGFAEATLFVVVADVWIGYVALRKGWRMGAAAAVAAAVSAAFGGLAIMLVARTDPAGARAALSGLPAVDAAMAARVRADLAADGLAAAAFGAFSGVPYKLYALAAGESGRSIPAFVLATPLIRLPRFFLAAAVAALAGRLLRHRTSERTRIGLYLAAWLIFYAVYFSVMP